MQLLLLELGCLSSGQSYEDLVSCGRLTVLCSSGHCAQAQMLQLKIRGVLRGVSKVETLECTTALIGLVRL